MMAVLLLLLLLLSRHTVLFLNIYVYTYILRVKCELGIEILISFPFLPWLGWIDDLIGRGFGGVSKCTYGLCGGVEMRRMKMCLKNKEKFFLRRAKRYNDN